MSGSTIGMPSPADSSTRFPARFTATHPLNCLAGPERRSPSLEFRADEPANLVTSSTMKGVMSNNEPPQPSVFFECLRFVLVLAWIILLLLAGTQIPLLVAHEFSPWLGMLAALLAFRIWRWFGPPASRGYV